jgi:hypothetical protein
LELHGGVHLQAHYGLQYLRPSCTHTYIHTYIN